MFFSKAIYSIILLVAFVHFSNIVAIDETIQSNNDENLDLNLTCAVDSDCHNRTGNYSVCYNRKCICFLGYLPMANGICSQMKCTNNTDCTKRFNDTLCNTKGECACATNYELNKKSEICHYVEPSKHMPIGVPIAIVVVIGILIACIAVYVLRIQKRREGYIYN